MRKYNKQKRWEMKMQIKQKLPPNLRPANSPPSRKPFERGLIFKFIYARLLRLFHASNVVVGWMDEIRERNFTFFILTDILSILFQHSSRRSCCSDGRIIAPRWTKSLSFCFHCRHTSLLLLTRWKAMTARVGKGEKHAWEFSRPRHRLFMELFVWKKDLQLDENERKSVLWGIMDFPLPFFLQHTYIVSRVRRIGQLSSSSKRKRTKKDSFYFPETLTQEPSLLFGLVRMDDDERSQVLWPSSKII